MKMNNPPSPPFSKGGIINRKEVDMEKKGKIMVVDDEPEFLLALQRALESESFDVTIARTKAEAQERIIMREPDIVILGTLTPGREASSLHKWIKQNAITKDMPIVVIDAPLEKRLISGWSIDEGVQMDAVEYLTKPVEPAALVPLIHKLLGVVTKRIKVLIVDDHTVVRDGIRALLTLQKDILVVGEAVDGKEAVEKALQLSPDVVLMDIVMPNMNGLEATKHICKECPQMKVLMLTQYADEENIIMSEQLGAYGFIPKSAASSQLLDGIRGVSRGERFKRPLAI
jgi:DNA-binding NarL/FixJ family response regulator